MSTPRLSIIAGPARITFRGQILFSSGDVIVSTRVRAFEVAAAGRPTQRREDEIDIELSFTPGSVWAPVCALLQTLGSLAVGQDIFRAAGGPMVIDSTDGCTYTYPNAALTLPPLVIFSAGRALFSPATFTALGARGTRIALADSVYPSPDGYDPAAVAARPYTLSWGTAADWTNLAVADDITLAFRLTLTPCRTDAAGLRGQRLADLSVTARAQPLGVPDAAVLAALNVQDPDAGRGRALGGHGTPDLVVQGAGVYACLHCAGLDVGSSRFGATLNRVGELGWTASVSRPAPDAPLRPLFELGTFAPSL